MRRPLPLVSRSQRVRAAEGVVEALPSIESPQPTVSERPNANLRRGTRFGNLEGGFDHSGDAFLRPRQCTVPCRPRPRDPAELGEKGMSTPGAEEPAQCIGSFGKRFAIVLDHRAREHAVNEILRGAPRAHLARVGEAARLLEHGLGEDGAPAPRASCSRLVIHLMWNRPPKSRGRPSFEGQWRIESKRGSHR